MGQFNGEAELEQIADRVADRAITKTFLMLGVDITDAKDIGSLQKDWAFVRELRNGSSKVKMVAIAAVIGTVIPAGLWLLWEGLRNIMSGR